MRVRRSIVGRGDPSGFGFVVQVVAVEVVAGQADADEESKEGEDDSDAEAVVPGESAGPVALGGGAPGRKRTRETEGEEEGPGACECPDCGTCPRARGTRNLTCRTCGQSKCWARWVGEDAPEPWEREFPCGLLVFPHDLGLPGLGFRLLCMAQEAEKGEKGGVRFHCEEGTVVLDPFSESARVALTWMKLNHEAVVSLLAPSTGQTYDVMCTDDDLVFSMTCRGVRLMGYSVRPASASMSRRR